MTNYHALAKSIKNSVKNGTVNAGSARNNLESIYAAAEENFYKNLPKNSTTRNRQANKLQEIMRWSQGHWNYKSATKN
jgi:hypothetical protein